MLNVTLKKLIFKCFGAGGGGHGGGGEDKTHFSKV